jgi:hypothetical protein
MNTIARCPCNLCSGTIEFDVSQAGSATSCPHCSMETTLFVPQRGQSESAPTFEPVEETFFQGGGLTITKTRFVAAGEVFALAGISSARLVRIPPRRIGPVSVSIFGLVLFPAAYWLVPAVVLSVGLAWLFLQKSEYAIMLAAAGGEGAAYTSKDRGLVQSAYEALQRAIIARG